MIPWGPLSLCPPPSNIIPHIHLSQGLLISAPQACGHPNLGELQEGHSPIPIFISFLHRAVSDALQLLFCHLYPNHQPEDLGLEEETETAIRGGTRTRSTNPQSLSTSPQLLVPILQSIPPSLFTPFHSLPTTIPNNSHHFFIQPSLSQVQLSNIQQAHCVHAKLLQSSPTLCNPTECSPPGSSVHGVLQARILQWVVMPSAGIFPTQGLNPHLLCLLY